jgi:hypothetical protein
LHRLGAGRRSTPDRGFPQSPSTPPGLSSGSQDFERYVAEHNIPEEEWPEAFAHWIAEQTGGPVPRFEKVEPGDEQILEIRSSPT